MLVMFLFDILVVGTFSYIFVYGLVSMVQFLYVAHDQFCQNCIPHVFAFDAVMTVVPLVGG